MLRKNLFLPAFFLIFSVCVVAAGKKSDPGLDDFNVLPAGSGGNLLHDYLIKECGKCFAARKKKVAAITTCEAVFKRQKELRKKWFSAIGDFPEKTSLNPKITGTLERKDYRIEKVIYESRPRHHVTAVLYLPKQGKSPFPGVLVPCGHSDIGKACVPYQVICIDLVKNGFVVLCYDPIGQGERFQTLNAKGKPIVGGTTEHTLIDIGARLTGGGVAAYRIWDGIRSIDYLVSRPEVDPKRIGCTGNSGGGTMTSYLMVTDDRIYAAAPSCYITSLERLFATIGPQDGEQNITAQVALGIDHSDYLLMRAPKPTLVLTARDDFFDIDGSWDSFREAKLLYSILGFGERLDLFEYPDKHGFNKPRREASLRWLLRWLRRIDKPAVETEYKLCTTEELKVTESGQVLYDLKGISAWDLNLKKAESLAAARKSFWRDNPEKWCSDKIRELAGIRKKKSKLSLEHVGVLKREGCRVQKLVIKREGEVPVPALLFIPGKRKSRPAAVLYVDGRGKAVEAASGGEIMKLVKAGKIVLSIDARGFGETGLAHPREYKGNEYPVSYLAIHLGRALLGQRVEDVFAALDLLLNNPMVDGKNISIVGVERGGPVALHAAYLDKRFKKVVIERSIQSWMDVVKMPLCKGQLSQIVPLALRYYDLPDLVNAITPEKVEVRNPVDPAGNLKT